MRKYKIVSLAIVFMSICMTFDSMAISKNDIKRKTLESIESKGTLNKGFYEYLSLKKDEVLISMYEGYIGSYKYMDKDLLKWYEIDSGSIFFDEILFSHPKVIKLYNEIKVETGIEKDEVLKKLTKNELILSIDEVDELIKESLIEYTDKNKMFEKIYNRKPNSKESEWLNNLNTLRYAAYSGYFKGNLNDESIEKINNDEGYKLLGYEFSRYDAITIDMRYIYTINEYEIEYFKLYDNFNFINSYIKSKFNINIFASLSEKERSQILKNSMDGFKFNDQKAYDQCLSLLYEKGLIKKNENIEDENKNEEGKKPSGNAQIQMPPRVERDEFFKDLQKNSPRLYDLYKFLNKKYSDMFKNIKASSQYDKEIWFKYDGNEYRTYIGCKEGNLPVATAKQLVNVVSKQLNGSAVYARYEAMLQIDKEITTFEEMGINGPNISFGYIKQKFEQMGVEVYLKNKQE